MNFENDEVRHLEFYLKECEAENKKLRKEIARLNDALKGSKVIVEHAKEQIDVTQDRNARLENELGNLKQLQFELSSLLINQDKEIERIRQENARLHVIEQAYEAMKKAF